MNETQDHLAFTVSLDQQIAVGSALSIPSPAVFMPHEFVQLLGQAQLAHDMYAQSAESLTGKERRVNREKAGIAQSVVVGVLSKVVELGDMYDVAVQAPVDDSLASANYEPNEMPAMFPPNLRAHYAMAAARMIDTVRQAQLQEQRYEQTFSQAS